MNVLEDQVTDLNSLAGSPIPLSNLAASAISMASTSGSPAMAESPVESGNIINNGKKRKSIAIASGEDGGAQKDNGMGNGSGEQRRAKRNRYISIAW